MIPFDRHHRRRGTEKNAHWTGACLARRRGRLTWFHDAAVREELLVLSCTM